MILEGSNKPSRLLEIYKRILNGEKINADGNSAQVELQLSGLVVIRSGQLKICNKIYERVFNLAWVEQ